MTIDVQAVGQELQDTLVDLTDLALQAKQAHWNLIGPNFRPIHLQLDELTAAARAASDQVAERAAAMGYAPDGRSTTVAKQSPLGDFPEGRVADRDVVNLIIERLTMVTTRLRGRVEKLDSLDKVTQDLIIEITAIIDKHRWMFDVQR